MFLYTHTHIHKHVPQRNSPLLLWHTIIQQLFKNPTPYSLCNLLCSLCLHSHCLILLCPFLVHCPPLSIPQLLPNLSPYFTVFSQILDATDCKIHHDFYVLSWKGKILPVKWWCTIICRRYPKEFKTWKENVHLKNWCYTISQLNCCHCLLTARAHSPVVAQQALHNQTQTTAPFSVLGKPLVILPDHVLQVLWDATGVMILAVFSQYCEHSHV